MVDQRGVELFFRFQKLISICLILCLVLPLAGCARYAKRPPELEVTDDRDDVPAVALPEEEQTPRKKVALTFDDGPRSHGDQTKNLMKELEKYGFHATFFVLGHRVAESGGGDVIRYAVENGHEIGIHGYSHKVYYDSCSDEAYREELSSTLQEILRYVPSYQVKLMRPIGGSITPERINSCPYAVIHWSVDSDDWNTENRYFTNISDEEAQRRVDTIVENVMSQVKEGDIILMHDIYESTYDAAKIIIQRLYEEGYEVVTVSELLGDDLQNGRIYHSVND